MWLQLTASNEDTAVDIESGVYAWDQGRQGRNAAINAFEVKQGSTPELASLFGYPGGEGFHSVLSSTVIGDSQISPRGYAQAAFDYLGLKPVGAGRQWAALG